MRAGRGAGSVHAREGRGRGESSAGGAPGALWRGSGRRRPGWTARKGRVLVAKAVETHKAMAVSSSQQQWKRKAKAVSSPLRQWKCQEKVVRSSRRQCKPQCKGSILVQVGVHTVQRQRLSHERSGKTEQRRRVFTWMAVEMQGNGSDSSRRKFTHSSKAAS